MIQPFFLGLFMTRIFLSIAVLLFSSSSYSAFYISKYIGFTTHQYRLKANCSDVYPTVEILLDCANASMRGGKARNYDYREAYEVPGSYELFLPLGVVAIISPVAAEYCGSISANSQMDNEQSACWATATDTHWAEYSGYCNEHTRKIESTCTLHENDSPSEPDDGEIIPPYSDELIPILDEFKTETNLSLTEVLTTIRESDAASQSKLEAISSVLESLESTNSDGFNKIKESLDASTDTEHSLNMNELNARLDSISDSNLQGAEAIVNAIAHSGSSTGTPSYPVPVPNPSNDMSGIESGLSGLADNIDSVGDKIDALSETSVVSNVQPDMSGTSFWTSSYPAGIEGIWSEKQVLFNQTSFAQWINSFKIQLSGEGSVPDWSLCFDLGIADFGCHDFKLDSRIWGAIRMFMLFSASVLCRRLVFGG